MHDTTSTHKPYQLQIIDLLLRIFEMFSDFYLLSAERFPHEAEFWRELAEDKKKHLDCLRKLMNSWKKGAVMFEEGKIKTYTLDAFLSYLAGVVTKAENGELSLDQTMTLARDLENSLVVRKVFEHFDAPSGEIKDLINRMNNQSEQHHRMVMETINRCSAG